MAVEEDLDLILYGAAWVEVSAMNDIIGKDNAHEEYLFAVLDLLDAMLRIVKDMGYTNDDLTYGEIVDGDQMAVTKQLMRRIARLHVHRKCGYDCDYKELVAGILADLTAIIDTFPDDEVKDMGRKVRLAKSFADIMAGAA